MIARLALGLAAFGAALLSAAGHAAETAAFRVPGMAPFQVITLGAPAEKAAAPEVDARGRLRVATERPLAKSAKLEAWAPVAGGYVTKVRGVSHGAAGLRVKLELGAVPGAFELRARGADGRVESMVIDPLNGPEAWSPWTEGEAQDIEIFSPVAPAPDAVRVSGLLHFDASPFAKAAAAGCTLSTACASGDPQLDAAIAERKKSVFRIQFVSGGQGFVCTATLIDTPLRPASYALTANHCIDDAASAASITSWWFYETASCASTEISGLRVQRSGARLVFTNFNLDATLLLMDFAPPDGALFSPVDARLVARGESVVSISHPRGDTSRWAAGISSEQWPDGNRPYWMYVVNFQRGIIEPGSSGSGLFTMSAGRLALRGILSQADQDLSCSKPNSFSLYPRLEVLYPQIAQYIGAATASADDAPNRTRDFVAFAPDPNGTDAAPLDQRTDTLEVADRRIDYAGDVDLYRFRLAVPAYVSAWTEGALDTVGALLNEDGTPARVDETDQGVAVDDAEWSTQGNYNFGITRRLAAGTYYLHIADWQPQGTGTYQLRLRADTVDTNYTDLWWNPAEPGWGINLNHQGTKIFATLFTYEAGGAPLWLVMSSGERQPGGAYEGTLYRTSGSPFNAVPFGPATVAPVGTMRIAFTDSGTATLTYTVNGTQVVKSIRRQVFDTPPTCTWSAFDRTRTGNYQDLWWNRAEPGWGLNISHQGLKMFATLFTYGADGRGLWLVMSDGNPNASGGYSGALYRTSGAAFDAPWSPATVTPVGSMTLNFTNGNSGTLTYTVNGATVTKQIERQTFGSIKTRCES